MSFSRIWLIALLSLHVVAADAADPAATPATHATREQLRACLDLEDGLAQRQRAIQAADAENQTLAARIGVEERRMRSSASKMDETNPNSQMDVDAMVKLHNMHVRNLDQAVAALAARTEAYNADVKAFSARCQGLTYMADDMDAVTREREKAPAAAASGSL